MPRLPLRTRRRYVHVVLLLCSPRRRKVTDPCTPRAGIRHTPPTYPRTGRRVLHIRRRYLAPVRRIRTMASLGSIPTPGTRSGRMSRPLSPEYASSSRGSAAAARLDFRGGGFRGKLREAATATVPEAPEVRVAITAAGHQMQICGPVRRPRTPRERGEYSRSAT